MVYLMREAQRLAKKYNSEQIFVALDPWNELSFEQFLSAIDKRYNSLEELNLAKCQIVSFKLDPGLSRTENICKFVAVVEAFNLKCNDGGEKWQGKLWSRDRIFEHIKLNLGLERGFVGKLIDVWKTKAAICNPETWGLEKIRSFSSEAEESYKFLHDSQQKKVLLTQNVTPVQSNPISSYSGPPRCFKCDGKMYKNADNRWACNCNEMPTCETCFGPHMTKYHDQVFASIMRSQRRLGLRLRGNAPSTE
eukprot:snap_masked-scaffold_3-processed-gene-4.22-mRNA-1 protein AED:1.00 eAED:1.00 QI:0/0/0/0/1/1/2/0/249